MAIKIVSACAVLAVVVLSPVRYVLTGRLDQDEPETAAEGGQIGGIGGQIARQIGKFGSGDNSGSGSNNYQGYLPWLYVAATYAFTAVVLHFLFAQTRAIIAMRQAYLGRQNSITDRTVKISGIPPRLRHEGLLRRHIEGLGLGDVAAVSVVCEWSDLNRLFALRSRVLRRLESYWYDYFAMNGLDPAANGLQPTLGEPLGLGSLDEDLESSVESVFHNADASWSALADDARRPQLASWFGKKVDAIDHYTQKLAVVDREIAHARSKEYPATSSAFVTMRSVAEAQLIAQAVLDPKVNHLTTTLAPAPHDIRWDNLCMTRKERNSRIGSVMLLLGLLSIVLVVPVSYLAKLLNVHTISKLSPKLGEFLKSNPWAQTLVTGILPPFLFTLFNVIMPYFYIWMTSKQGFTSHSDEEISSVSKNFFYTFVNLFLVFTLVGTASLSDTVKIAFQLAQSLRQLSLFYVDLIILQGLGIFPYKLLLFGNLLQYSFGSLLWCKTPRDYLRLYKPPVFNFGLQLPQPMLVLIIVMIYSVMSTKILTAGLAYFLIGYFVFKYQLLYACVHPPHSTGKVWPLIFHRVILGLFIFHIMMAATFGLQKSFVCVAALAPLPLVVLACLWNFEKNYVPLSYFIALNSVQSTQPAPYHDEEAFLEPLQPTPSAKTLDERREINQTYDYPHLIESLDGPLIAVGNNDVLLVNNDGTTVRKSKTSVRDFD